MRNPFSDKTAVERLVCFGLIAGVVLVSCFNDGSIREIVGSRGFPRDFALLLRHAARWLAGGAMAATVLGCALLLAVPGLKKPHRSFLLVVLLTGPLYVFSLTPLSPADEKFHWAQTIQVASELSGRTQLDSAFTMDMFLPNNQNRPDGYVRMMKTFDRPKRKAECIDWTSERWKRHGTWIMHATQIAGVVFGLATGAPPLVVFYLGRLFSLLVYAGVVFWSIRASPFFKRTLSVVACCPIAMQQVCSYSYDAESITLGFLCFAIAMKHVSAKGGEFGRTAAAGVLAAFAVGMAAKCAAFPFLPLLLLLPADGFRSGRAGKIRFLSAVAVVACAAAATCASVTPNALWNKPFGGLAYGGESWTPSALASDPVSLFRILVNTFDRFGLDLFYDSFGRRLSGLSLRIHAHCTVLFVVLFFVAAFRDGREVDLDPVRPLRSAAAWGWFLLTGYLCFIMLTSWTPKSAVSIQGFQGRYWTPVLPLAAVALFARSPGRRTAAGIEESGGASTSSFDRLLFPVLLLAHCDVVFCIVKATLRN